MRLTIHQPEHMPWPGFFHKVNMADVYVVLDDVQYRRRYFQNRNRIKTAGGPRWLTAPLKKEDRDSLLIKDAELFTADLKWKQRNLETIYHNYSKAEFFKCFWAEFSAVYSRDYFRLRDFNMALLRFFFKKLGIKTDIRFSSALNVSGKKGELIFNICRKLGAATYISGISGRDYLDMDSFRDKGIEVVIQRFRHPVYRQLYGPFAPCMSVIDLLFNCGEKSLAVINGENTPVMEKIFF